MKIKDLEVGKAYKTTEVSSDVIVLGKVEVYKSGGSSRWSSTVRVYRDTFTTDFGAKPTTNSLGTYKVAVARRGHWNGGMPTWVFDTVEAFQILGLADEVNAAKAKAAAERAEYEARLAASKAARTEAIQAQIDAAAELGVKVGMTYSSYSGYQTVEISVEELATLISMAKVGAELTAGGR